MVDILKEIQEIFKTDNSAIIEINIAELIEGNILIQNIHTIANSPLLSEILDTIPKVSDTNKNSISKFVLAAFENIDNDISFVDSTESLFERPDLSQNIEEKLIFIFYEKCRSVDTNDLIRTASLEAILHFSYPDRRRLLTLQNYLLDISGEDTPNFISHAIKIIGFLYAHLQEEELLKKLDEIATIDEAAAAFEKGMAQMRMGLGSQDKEVCSKNFKAAIASFAHSINLAEVSPQAQIYLCSLEILYRFYKNRSIEEIEPYFRSLNSAIFEYEFWTSRRTSAAWMGAINTGSSGFSVGS